jgi:hypothetical protein
VKVAVKDDRSPREKQTFENSLPELAGLEIPFRRISVSGCMLMPCPERGVYAEEENED